MRLSSILLLIALSLPLNASAQDDGQVQLPLDVYRELLRLAESEPRPAPAGYALGNANVTAVLNAAQSTAVVSVTLRVEVFEDEWVLIPVLPTGTAVTSATVSGRPLQLISTTAGLMWAVNNSGVFDLALSYQAGVERYESGQVLPLPLPVASSTRLTATLPGTELGVSVIPATSVDTEERGGNTVVNATIPASSGVQLSWRDAVEGGMIMSRASYSGQVEEDAVTWQAEFSVEVGTDEPTVVGLLNNDVALLGMQVDGDETPITVESNVFSVTVSGRGGHTISAQFQVPIDRSSGQPRVELRVPSIPVSRFELVLEGEKEVTVTPAASVVHTHENETTVAVVNVPMTDRVGFNWLEAVPDSAVSETEVRANATVYHTAHADEGVLYIRAVIEFDVTRGETSQFELELPLTAQINVVQAENGAVADWRRSTDDPRVVTVFLDRRVSGVFTFEVSYEQLFTMGTEESEELTVPLVTARGVFRQRGMVALLAGRDLTLEPRREESLSVVGENALPAELRESIEMTIAHTYRYFEDSPVLAVAAVPPERDPWSFDAQVDSLISLGDVTTVGQVTVEINVKQGSIEGLELLLPAGVNFLSLTAPSLRNREVRQDEAGGQLIDVEFTQEMEGQFRVDVNYEQITGDAGPELTVPLVHVRGADVEQGRIAVEALSAVEVQATGQSETLSTVDIGELPQQLILRTTNPILMAFKYAHADPPPHLALTITHHTELEVQAATIDRAHYRTLYTRDGFTLTSCNFTVRNSREQFLRVRLPADSEVWSATVNGESETPALANDGQEGGPEVLINIINSAQGFPVELIYATPMPALEFRGDVTSTLPRPDMVVTQTVWDIFVPEDLRYGEPETNLDIVAEGVHVSGSELGMGEDAMRVSSANVDEPIHIDVPQAGLRFSFEKLYANQVDEEMSVSIPYATEDSARWGSWLSLAGTILLWLGLLGLVLRKRLVPRFLLLSMTLLGAALLVVSLGYLDASPDRPVQLSAAFFILAIAGTIYSRVFAGLKARKNSE